MDPRRPVDEETDVRRIAKDSEDGLRPPATCLSVLVDGAHLVRARGDRSRERTLRRVREHPAHRLRLLRSDDELPRRGIGDIAERQLAGDAKPTCAARCTSVSKALGDHVALELGEDREGVEAELCERVVGAVEIALDDADRDSVGAERMLDARPIEDPARKTIEPMHDDAIDSPVGDGVDEAIERGAVGGRPALAFVVEVLEHRRPAEVRVRCDEAEAGGALQGA